MVFAGIQRDPVLRALAEPREVEIFNAESRDLAAIPRA